MQKRFIVQGRVQGVGFRQFTFAKARALPVSGFVRNLPDGSVECVARGSEEALAELESILRKGPPVSRVESVTASPSETPLPPGFRIA